MRYTLRHFSQRALSCSVACSDTNNAPHTVHTRGIARGRVGGKATTDNTQTAAAKKIHNAILRETLYREVLCATWIMRRGTGEVHMQQRCRCTPQRAAVLPPFTRRVSRLVSHDNFLPSRGMMQILPCLSAHQDRCNSCVKYEKYIS